MIDRTGKGGLIVGAKWMGQTVAILQDPVWKGSM
jgi:hypothetical protein